MFRIAGVLCVLMFVTDSLIAATTLELRVVSDADEAIWVAEPGETVNLYVQGRLVGDRADGLASWSAELRNVGNAIVDLCGCADMWSAEECPWLADELAIANLNESNRATIGVDTPPFALCHEAMDQLALVGGPHAMPQVVKAPSSAGGSVDLNADASGWTVLAEGQLIMPDYCQPSDAIELALDAATARVFTRADERATTVVGAAKVSVVGSLSIRGLRVPVVTSVWSWGYHDAPVSADLGIQVFPFPSMIEPRQTVVGGHRIYLEVVFDVPMSVGPQMVIPSPGIGGIVAATPPGSSTVIISFPVNLPLDQTCYQFDMAGSVAPGMTEPPGNDFCVCYLEGDVDRSGTVNAGDRNLVVSTVNFFLPASVAANLTADLDRSGMVNAGDRNLVVSPSNFFTSPTPCPP